MSGFFFVIVVPGYWEGVHADKVWTGLRDELDDRPCNHCFYGPAYYPGCVDDCGKCLERGKTGIAIWAMLVGIVIWKEMVGFIEWLLNNRSQRSRIQNRLAHPTRHNPGTLRYRSPVSGNRTTTRLASPSLRATSSAATATAPEDMPTNNPSQAASARVAR